MVRRPERRFWISYGSRLGRNLYELRKMRGLTQERLAELAGVSRNMISNIERNENNDKTSDPVLSTIYLLARALHIPPSVLLPAGDQYVEDICTAEGPRVDLVWPAHPEDTLPFDARHLYKGRQGDHPGFNRNPPLSAAEESADPKPPRDPEIQGHLPGD
ncbi:helix-turn-helix domain-containing protein [Corynebacterium sp. A21]|uniref:helix-turn-helix domain-containing protein n=1 Tax=Corynebacterium sp. A21 TaxID=3457318 RepID=UPI003FD3A31F